ncbi:hypothetical protein GOP47_0008301 [Adiantum capillus-veneris]|uniref:Uncharacterized protein n=1 Tax=Adiantum capillus-veneris TaxID=13818 RepID=A0A9D4UYJ4_ADICA|nr:hypothetical protein GOP47_0008301 [Adiantum capillus-veneris]
MNSLTSCCAHDGARQGITPYQRLPRSRSTSSHPDITPDTHNHHSHHFVDDDLEPDQCKGNSTHHNASSQSKLSDHDSVREKFCSTSGHINPHSRANLRRTCSNGQATTVSSIAPSSSQQVNSMPRRIGNVETFVDMLKGSQIQRGSGSVVHLGSEDVNTVLVKVAIIGDSRTGKTSFMARYGGVELKKDAKDIALLRKLCKLQHVNIALHIWDLGGQWQYSAKMPMVCKDAATIFIMFDLTRRSTLQSVKKWYLCARESNKVALIVLIGTKYDGFVQLSKEFQLAIIEEARIHSKKMKAPLFFSSVTYNINVHKVFKVVVAKLFDLPCRITQNSNFGEPIVSY